MVRVSRLYSSVSRQICRWKVYALSSRRSLPAVRMQGYRRLGGRWLIGRRLALFLRACCLGFSTQAPALPGCPDRLWRGHSKARDFRASLGSERDSRSCTQEPTCSTGRSRTISGSASPAPRPTSCVRRRARGQRRRVHRAPAAGYRPVVGERGIRLFRWPAPAHRHRRAASPADARSRARRALSRSTPRERGDHPAGARSLMDGPHDAGSSRTASSSVVNAAASWCSETGRVVETGTPTSADGTGGAYARLMVGAG